MENKKERKYTAPREGRVHFATDFVQVTFCHLWNCENNYTVAEINDEVNSLLMHLNFYFIVRIAKHVNRAYDWSVSYLTLSLWIGPRLT